MRILPPGTIIPNLRRKPLWPFVLFCFVGFVTVAVAANRLAAILWP